MAKLPDLSLPSDIGASAGVQSNPCDKVLQEKALGTERTRLSRGDMNEEERRRWDSNPGITVLQTVAFGRLATPPEDYNDRFLPAQPAILSDARNAIACRHYSRVRQLVKAIA